MRLNFTRILAVFIVLMSPLATMAQEITVSGVVTSSEDGLTMPGVSIVVVGTTNGTSTDFDGNYSITANQGDELSFSFIGFTTKVVEVTGTTVNMILDPDATALEEVVVTGYAKETRATIAGSITVVDASELEQVPVASFDQALQGRAAGLQVTSGSGQPGAASSVRIRGASSISGGADPLYIMDGVQISGRDFAALNPNDFASFSVLKDASATAIYGSRGTNGVIVITTKKGSEGKTKINYRFNYGYSKRNDMKTPLMNSEEKLLFEKYVGRGPGADIEEGSLEWQRLSNINTNWTDIFTRNGITKQHELSASGGSQKTQYFMSISYFDQEGIALSSDLERITGRFNFKHKLYDNLTVGANMSIGSAAVNEISAEGSVNLRNVFATAYLANPYEKLYHEDGSLTLESDSYAARNYQNLVENTRSYEDLKMVGSFSLTWDITDELSFKTLYGIDNTKTVSKYSTNPTTWFGQNDDYKTGSLSQSYADGINSTFTNLLSYNKYIEDKHNIGLMLGQEWVESNYESFGYQGYGVSEKLNGSPASLSPASIDDDGNLFNAPSVIKGGRYREVLLSYFFDARYTYNEKYTIRGNFRMDASSKFTKENRWAKLGSVGFIWNAGKESFIEEIDIINDLKVKASYGVTGNKRPIGPTQKDFTWRTGSYRGEQGYLPATLGNQDLVWETSHKSNLGLESSMFESRLRASVELYHEKVTNNFVSYNLSRTTGFSSIMYNAGSMENKGIELDVNYDILTGDFKWGVFANYAYNKNEITDLGQVNEFEDGTAIIREGLSLGTHYIVGWAGVDYATGAPLYYDKDGNVTAVYSADNNVANFGTYIPPSIGGIGTNMSWKGFDFNMMFSFQTGFKRFNNQRFFQENHNFTQFNMSTEMNDIWKEPGDITDIQGKSYNLEFTSKFIEDASFLKLRDISIGYNVPNAIASKVKMQKLRVYGRVQNLLTWTSWTGFDPEDDNNIAQYEYPTPTIFTFGLDVNF
ncbi:MAG: TonB-dependent receptor [Bacteroidota bacterium]